MLFKRLTILSIIMVLLTALGLLSLVACTEGSQNAETNATVTFLGNSGFLVTLGDRKVMIDGMYAGFPNDYVQPEEVVDRITRAEPPFDDIDLILSTHAHEDHFDATRVAAYLEKNRDAIFLSTEDASGQILANHPSLSTRVTGIALASGESREWDINGLRIVAYDISHGFSTNGERYPNLGFLVEANGFKIFHAGDLDTLSVPASYLKLLGLPEEGIDIAFLPHFVFRNIGDLSLATDGVAARYSVPIHYAFTTPPFNTQIIQLVFPPAVLFDKELDTWLMPDDRSPAATPGDLSP